MFEIIQSIETCLLNPKKIIGYLSRARFGFVRKNFSGNRPYDSVSGSRIGENQGWDNDNDGYT
jgi:hypothetical protein